MSEKEEESVSGHSNRHLYGAGDGPVEIARQMREAGERCGSYISQPCGFIKINNRRTKSKLLINVDNVGLTFFSGGDGLTMLDDMIDWCDIRCYLCDRNLDIKYNYIIMGIRKLIPINYRHLCCMCSRIMDEPEKIKKIIGGCRTPYVIVLTRASEEYINVFHLIRYLKTIDKQKADAVRKVFKKKGVPLSSDVLKDFYK